MLISESDLLVNLKVEIQLVPQQKLYSCVVNNYPVTTTAAMSVYSFAIQEYLYIVAEVIYTVYENHAWRFSSAIPRIDYVYVCQAFW